MALISMLIIIITIITQGARVPENLRGNLKGSLFVRDGVFQAIGVISFGKEPLQIKSNSACDRHMLNESSFRMPYAYSVHKGFFIIIGR